MYYSKSFPPPPPVPFALEISWFMIVMYTTRKKRWPDCPFKDNQTHAKYTVLTIRVVCLQRSLTPLKYRIHKRVLTLRVVCQQRSLTPLKYRLQKSSDSAGCLPTKESDSADIPHAKEFWLRGKRFYSNTAVSSTPWIPTPWWAAKGKTGVSIMKILAKYKKEKQRSCVKLPLNCISFNRVRFPSFFLWNLIKLLSDACI